MDLRGKVVVVTGSSSGIGRAIAVRFAKEGASIVVTYHINKKGGEETKKEIERLGGKCLLTKLDVTKPKDIEKLFKRVLSEFGTVDVLINNAAWPGEKISFFKAKKKDILELFDADIVGAMMCSKYAIPIMQKQGHGKILNTSSIKGWEHGGGSMIVYAVSKAAINSFTRTLAKQVAPSIQVNAVAPGYVRTRIYGNATGSKIKKYIEGTYLKRWITVEEVADAFIFLAKNDAMTGQIIYVDGGFTLK